MNGKPSRQANKYGLMAGSALKGIFGFIGRLFVTMIMVGVITGCIVGSVLTVYILQYIDADEEINLEEYSLGYTTIMYYTDPETGEDKELQRMYNSESNRIWVDYAEIPQHTKDALVAIEDKRFWDHQGVDWRRTIVAFAGQFMPISGTISGGGSTITQQLIKNITKDDDFRVDRKVREIFRALNLSQRYTREQVLEAYLNTVSFGNGTNGIESAANAYFGKHARDLTLAESAAIVGITQFPTKYNPFLFPENNKERREYVLYEMFDQGKITQAEYDAALAEPLVFKKVEYEQKADDVWSYFVDYVVNQVIADLMEKKGWTYQYARQQFYEGGYRIKTTVDMDIQNWLEEVYLNPDLFPAVHNADYPQSACTITDINGKILGIVGGIGKKESALVLNRAADSRRQPGSSIKPLATYALAFENNRVTWSTIVDDHPINIAKPGQPDKWWPNNYYSGFAGNITIDRAINNSVNTVAAKIMQVVTPDAAFDFLKNDLNFHSLVEEDRDLAPMAIGALTYGVSPLEMAGGYQIFANGGYFTTPYAYTEVRDSNGKIILQTDTTPRQVIGEDTSVVINKLLQRVTSAGTGTPANLGIMPTAGKTGTSEYDIDQWFMGFTPYYVCEVWLGYDMPMEMKVNPQTGTRQAVRNTISYAGLGYPPPKLWKTIMLPLAEKQERKEFPESPDVVSRTYCTISGNLSTTNCTSVATGWYKKSRIPPNCSGNHVTESDSSGSSSGAPERDVSSSSAADNIPSTKPRKDSNGIDIDVN